MTTTLAEEKVHYPGEDNQVHLKIFTGEYSDVAMARTRRNHYILNLDLVHPVKQTGALMSFLRDASKGLFGKKVRLCCNNMETLELLNNILVSKDYGGDLSRDLGWDVDLNNLDICMMNNNRQTYKLDRVPYVEFEGFSVPWFTQYMGESLTMYKSIEKLMEKYSG